MSKINFLTTVVCIMAISSCAPEPLDIEIENQFGQLPTSVVQPPDNLPSSEKIMLGKLLFWDPILSGNKDIACVTCHHPNNGYAELLDLSIGVGGEGLSEMRSGGTIVKRNSQTILNSAFNGIDETRNIIPENAPMLWDSRIQSLEKQAILPILSAEEMRGEEISEESIMEIVLLRLKSIPEYNDRFTAVFGANGITEENLGKAIAAFERTLISNNSRFDQYARGDKSALTSLEIRGMINFSEVGCANCHNGPMFSDFELHVLTVPENEKLNAPDIGSGEFAFRTPSLRNLNLTAPYMHNGVFSTLDEVLEFYDDVDEESQNPNIESNKRAEKLRQLDLPDDKVASIIAFLNSLNDETFDKDIIARVPSNLKPGGNID